MLIRSLKQISQTGSLALISTIEGWKDVDAFTVLLAYAELKRRNYSLPSKAMKCLSEYCAKHDALDIDSLLTNSLKNIGFDSFNEYYEKEIGTSRFIINPTLIISAGKNIKSIVNVTLVMILSVLIAIWTVYSSRDYDTIKDIYIILGIVSLFCNILILSLLHSAGDNLVKSVTEKQ